jgi:hypothetical protein
MGRFWFPLKDLVDSFRNKLGCSPLLKSTDDSADYLEVTA